MSHISNQLSLHLRIFHLFKSVSGILAPHLTSIIGTPNTSIYLHRGWKTVLTQLTAKVEESPGLSITPCKSSCYTFHLGYVLLPIQDISDDRKQLNNELHCILVYPGSQGWHRFLASIPGTYSNWHMQPCI